MGILSVPSGAAFTTSSSSSSSAYPDSSSVVLIRRSSSTSWPSAGTTTSRPQHQHHHPELLWDPHSSPTTTTHKKKRIARTSSSWKTLPQQQQQQTVPQSASQDPNRGQQSSLQQQHPLSQAMTSSSSSLQFLVAGGSSSHPHHHHRPTTTGPPRPPPPPRTRTSLLFVVVAGGVAFLQLAYYVNYLVDRYPLEYSIRTTTTSATSLPANSLEGLLKSQSYHVPATKTILASSLSSTEDAGRAGGNLRSTSNHVLEIKLTTTTTTTTTTIGDNANTKSTGMSNLERIGEVSNAIPVTTTTTVTTQQLNFDVAAAAVAPSLPTTDAQSTEGSGDKGRKDGSAVSQGSKVENVPSKARIPDEVKLLGGAAASAALLSRSSTSRPYEVLVVVPGLGEATRIPNVEHSLLAIRTSLTKGGYGFGCQVYVWNDDILDEARSRLAPLQCDLRRSKGMWTHHMSRVPNVMSTNYTHVGVLLDDVDVSQVQMVDFLHLMDWSQFGVASPAFDDPIYQSMHVRYNCFFHRTDFVNIFFAVFTADVWSCWQANLIDTERNPLGWGMDATLHRVCNASLGVIDAYTGIHRETRTSYSQTEAREQMYRFIASRVNTDQPKRYLECAGQERPAAFEECQLYWDGTEAQSSVDWQC